jgi:glycosyltransferase involved in cell wall biosynthesis
MNVCIFIYRYSIGGVETFATTLARGLKKYPGANAHIYVMIPESVKENGARASTSDVPVYTAYTSRWVIIGVNVLARFMGFFSSYPIRQKILYACFKRHLRRMKIDVVHSNYHLCDEFAHRTRLEIGIPYVVTDHGSYRTSDEYESRVQIMQNVASTCSVFVYLTKESLANFKAREIDFNSNCQILRVWNGWERDVTGIETKSPSSRPFTFGLISRGDPSKGWEASINAFLLFRNKRPKADVKLVLTGDGSFLDTLKSTYANNPSIHFTGPTDSPIDVVRTFDVGLLPSTFVAECMPYSIIQYLSLGKPCLATANGAIMEMLSVENEMAGSILYLANDGKIDVEAFSEQMIKMYEQPDYYAHCLEMANRAFEKFDSRLFAQEYYKSYQFSLSVL